jgi:aldose 1-epimerase
MRKSFGLLALVCVAAGLAGCSREAVAPGEEASAPNTTARIVAENRGETDGAAAASGSHWTMNAAWDKTPDGHAVTAYTLMNRNGLEAVIIDYGATLVSMKVPDRDGNLADVVLGFDRVEPYMGASPYMGSTVGRYANRIAKGTFTLDGKTYTLAINNEPNHLHGGTVGYDKVFWTAEPKDTEDGPSVVFTHRSPDGDEGYPGNLDMTVIYTLTHDNALRIDYEATTDAATPVNLTHHSYFNLGGHASSEPILDHELTIQASRYTPVDDTLIPVGDLAAVAGTPYDFTTPQAIGARLDGVYDHNYVLDSDDGSLALAARAVHPASGRVMEIWTTEPGLQFYTGFGLDGSLTGKDGAVYHSKAGFCLEAQKFPDSPNKPHFPSSILRPGETYTQRTEHRFSTQ